MSPSKMSSQGGKVEGKMGAIPDLQNMLDECKRSKVVDSKIMKKAVDTVKAFLKSDIGKVDALLEYKGMVGVLVQCLKQGGMNCSLQFSVVWIVDIILTKGGDQLVRALIEPNIRAIPSIVKLLQSPDPTIYEKASKVIVALSKVDDAIPQLWSNSTDIFTHLGKLIKSKKLSPDFSLSAAKIVTEMVFKASGEESQSFEKILKGEPIDCEVRRFSSKPPMEDLRLTGRVLKQALGLIPQLLELDCLRGNDIRREIFKCLMSGSATRVPNVEIGSGSNIGNPVVEAGCSSKIVEFLSDPDDAIAFGVAYITWQIAYSGEKVFFDFLRALDDSGGLSSFSRVFKLDLKMFPQLRKITNEILVLVQRFIEGGENGAVQMVLNSGLVDSMIVCMKQPSGLGKSEALRNISTLLDHLPVPDRGLFGVLLPEVVRVINAPPVGNGLDRLACVKILALLLEGSAVRRDDALTLEAPSALANLVRSHGQLSEGQIGVVFLCIKRMVGVKPHAEIGTFKEILKAFISYIKECKPYQAQELLTCLEIPALLLEYEKREGVEAILSFYEHLDIEESFRLCAPILSVWLDITFKLVTLGSSVNRKKMLCNGLLKGLQKAIQFGNEKNKLFALDTLRLFIETTKFCAVELAVVKTIEPVVVAETKSRNLVVQREAKLVLKKMRRLKANGLGDDSKQLQTGSRSMK